MPERSIDAASSGDAAMPADATNADHRERKVAADVPEYISYWQQERERLSDEDSPDHDRARANLARAKFAVLQRLRTEALHGNQKVSERGVAGTHLGQLSQFIHMLGPENPLDGAAGDLELVAERILEHLDDEPLESDERASAQLDAAGAYAAASRVARSQKDRERLRSEAFGLSKQIVSEAETGGFSARAYLVDSFMMHQDLELDTLYDALDASPVDIDDPNFQHEFRAQYSQILLRHLNSLQSRLGQTEGRIDISPGKAFEWWFALSQKYKLLASGNAQALLNTRVFSALPHEDAPHHVKGMDDVLSDGRDIVVRERSESNDWETTARLQLKSHTRDAKRYRKPVVEVGVSDEDLQETGNLTRLMRKTVAEMIQKLESGDLADDSANMEYFDESLAVRDGAERAESHSAG